MERLFRFAGYGALLSACVLSGCGWTGGSPKPINSGIEGQSMVDGGCPVIRPNSPCPAVPVGAVVTVLAADQTVVATAQTSGDGRFRIMLPPGEYTLDAKNSRNTVFPRAARVVVTVEQGRFRTVVVMFDSGIRRPRM